MFKEWFPIVVRVLYKFVVEVHSACGNDESNDAQRTYVCGGPVVLISLQKLGTQSWVEPYEV